MTLKFQAAMWAYIASRRCLRKQNNSLNTNKKSHYYFLFVCVCLFLWFLQVTGQYMK